jgi:Domain of unknown function (DUF4907)
MTIRNTYSLIAIAALLICIAVIFFNKHKGGAEKMLIYAEPVQTVYGWGYNIITDGKVQIKQEYIPAVPGKKGFKSASDAMLAGNLAVKKMSLGQWPTITFHELDSLGVYKDSTTHQQAGQLKPGG